MRQRSRKQKTYLNTLVMGLYEIVSFACGLILPRLILSYYGSGYNGIIASISQFLSFITILQIGIAGSTRYSLYKVLAERDQNGISGIVNATERYMRKVGGILVAYISLLAIVYPFIANSDLSHGSIAALVVIIGMSSFAQYFFGITYQILLMADQRQYIYHLLLICASTLNTIIAIILMVTGNSIYTIKIGSTLVFVMLPIVLGLIIKHDYKIDKRVPPNNSGLKGRWDVMWHSVANIIHNNTDLVVLTIFSDVKVVSVYTVHYLVINGLYKVLSIFTTSLEAGFGSLFAKKENDKAYHHLMIYEFFMCMMVSILFSCALVLIEPFVRVYTRGITDINYVVPTFAYIAIAAQIIMCYRQPYLTVVQAAGHYKQTRNGAFVEAGINVCLSIALIFKFGMVGVAIGTLAADMFRTGQYILYLRKNILSRCAGQAIRTIIWSIANIVCIFAICRTIINSGAIDSGISWIISGVICFVIACAFSFLSAFLVYRKRLIETKNVIKRMVLKRSSAFSQPK